MFGRLPFLLLSTVTALIPSVLAADCSSTQKYITIPSFAAPKQCVPSGYFQSQDMGNTSPTDLTSRCESQCTGMGSRCFSYVGQLWKAADSDLYTGQCFFYSAAPPAAVSCADSPSVILAEQKDTISSCFASSASVATAFCSSMLSIGTVTSYTSTVTPTTTIQSTLTSTISTTSTATLTQVVSETSVIVVSSSSTSTVMKTQAVTATATVTATVTVATSTTTVFPTTKGAAPSAKKRAVTSPLPSCVPTIEPGASVSSACACLSITSPTVYLVSTAPTVTHISVSTSNPVTTIIHTVTVTSKVDSFTTSTDVSVATITSTVTTTVATTSSTSTSTVNVLATFTACPVPSYSIFGSSGSDYTLTGYEGGDANACCVSCYASYLGCSRWVHINKSCFIYIPKSGPTNAPPQCPNGVGYTTFRYGGDYTGGAGPCGTISNPQRT